MADTSAIYVIDDDPAVVKLVCRMLTSRGYAPQTFTNGEDFFTLANRQLAGCLITDLHLPGLSGAEIQAQLNQEGSPLSVIVISGAADLPTAVKVMKQGAVTFIQKPYTPEELLEAVEQGLARSRQQLQQTQLSSGVMERLRRLNEEELQVLDYVLQGAANKVISADLVMSSRTVDRRRHSILEKMEVKTVHDLTVLLANLPREKLQFNVTAGKSA